MKNQNEIDTRKIRHTDFIQIIFGNKCLEKNHKKKAVVNFSLDEILSLAEYNGYVSGTLTLITQNSLMGKVYQYNQGQWRDIGQIAGYCEQLNFFGNKL